MKKRKSERVVFHSSLTKQLSDKIENVQKTCLKIILEDMYISYNVALEMCNLQTLYERRELRCLTFGYKCTLNKKVNSFFPLQDPKSHDLRKNEKYYVKFARTEAYKKSPIIHIQKLLNNDCQ